MKLERNFFIDYCVFSLWKNNIEEFVLNETSIADFKSADGLSTLLEFLDRNFGKDELTDSLDKFEDFNKFQRRERLLY